MSRFHVSIRFWLTTAAVVAMLGCTPPVGKTKTGTTTTTGSAAGTSAVHTTAAQTTVGSPIVAKPAASDDDGQPIEFVIDLPAPAFRGTPVPQKEAHVEKPLNKPREPFLAPAGTTVISRDKPVTCSVTAPTSGEVDYVTDGDKEASDFGYLELPPGSQWVQIDLAQKSTVYYLCVWHNHAEARVYRDVVVQIDDDPDFLNPTTVYNNDYDGSSGLGIGEEMGYVETNEGRLIDCRGAEGRYVRLYSNGNHIDAKNHYTEVEVYGRPAE